MSPSRPIYATVPFVYSGIVVADNEMSVFPSLAEFLAMKKAGKAIEIFNLL
jgi:hypothetical protein